MAKRHHLKEILSNMAIEKAVESIWIKGVISNEENSQWYTKLNVPKTLFFMNVSTDLLFFMLLSLMMLTGMCVKARAQLFILKYFKPSLVLTTSPVKQLDYLLLYLFGSCPLFQMNFDNYP